VRNDTNQEKEKAIMIIDTKKTDYGWEARVDGLIPFGFGGSEVDALKSLVDQLATPTQRKAMSGFRYKLGQLVSWKIVPGSRVLICERSMTEYEPDVVVRRYLGNVADGDYVAPQGRIVFYEHELTELEDVSGRASAPTGT
jgi:hypothetical protein